MKKMMMGMVLAILCLTASPSSAQSQQYILTVHNLTTTTIVDVRAAYPDSIDESITGNLLDYTIPTNNERTVQFRGTRAACMIALGVQYANGVTHALVVNACSPRHIDATANGLVVTN